MTRILLILIAFSGIARADEVAMPSPGDKQRVERLSSDAAEHYRAGRFRDAITLYEDAWAIFPAPGVLYNIARCHEALGLWMEAADRYDKVVVDGAADPDLRGRAVERSRLARQQAARQAMAPPPNLQVEPEPVFAPTAAATERDPGPNGEVLRTSAWVLGGVGAAALVTGSVLLGLGASDLDDVEAAKHDGVGDLTRVEAMELRDQGEARRSAGTVVMILGGAALLGSILTLATTDAPSRARVAPAPTGLTIAF